MSDKATIKIAQISLEGVTPIMFDRYPGNNSSESALDPMDKMYISSEDGETVVLPSENVMSYLTAQNTESAPKRLIGKSWRKVAMDMLSFTTITPFEIPFLRNGKKLTKKTAGFTIRNNVARVKKGSLAIPSPKSRPILPLPWGLDFQIKFIERDSVNATTLKRLFVEGGLAIGFGTWRGVYGKFRVQKFVVTDAKE